MRTNTSSRLLHLILVTKVSICLAAGVACIAIPRIAPTAVRAAGPDFQSLSSPLTWTLFLPLVMVPLDVRFGLIGYNCCKCCPGQFEHIHFQNFGSSPVKITGWRIKSGATGDSFTFPTATAKPYTTSVNTEMTLLTNYDTVDNIHSFNWGKSYEEWPNSAGPGDIGYLYDNLGRLIATCHYTPTNDGSGDAPCQ